MPDEQNYVGFLLTFEDAAKALHNVYPELSVLEYSIACFHNHHQILKDLMERPEHTMSNFNG